MSHPNKPNFEPIYGVYVIPPGYLGVKRHLGKIVEVLNSGRALGIPFFDDIAAVPVLPSRVEELEHKVRSRDNRWVTLTSDTTFTISDPLIFMRKAPDDYLLGLVPKISQSVQQIIGSQYTIREVVEKNNQIGQEVQEQLNIALKSLDWGLVCRLFCYIADTDHADILLGDAEKGHKAELYAARAEMEITVANTEAEAQLKSITDKSAADRAAYSKKKAGETEVEVAKMIGIAEADVRFTERKYQTEAEAYHQIKVGEAMASAQRAMVEVRTYSLKEEGDAAATALRKMGMAEMDIREKKLAILTSYVETAAGVISSTRASLQPGEMELLIPCLLSPLEKLIGEDGGMDGELKSLREGLIHKVNERLKGQARGNNLNGVSSASGVNPNTIFIADKMTELVDSFKGNVKKQ